VTNQAKFRLSVLAVAMLCSTNVWAGLGRINVRSYLGEAFHADIELTGVRSSELEGARVGLASPDTFRDLNVDYAGTMSALRFNIVPSAHGAIIRVSSAVPINDPYLRFVVEAKTSSGRSVREYTVLLDPASYTAPSSKAIVQDLPQYADENLSSRYQGKSSRAGRNVSPGVIQTRSGSTLRGVAMRVRPAGASVEQTMAALVQANPHGFDDGSPDKLKAGITLKVPSASKIKSLTPTQVASILHVDNAAAGAATESRAQPAKGKSGDVLKLVAPDGAGEPADAKLSALEQQVSAREQAVKDAEARIAALEQQLKAMQSGKPQASQPTAAAPAPASTPSAAVEALPPQTSAPAVQPVPVPAPKPVAAPKPLLPPPPAPQTSWLDSVIDNLPLIGGGVAGIGLLGLLGALIARRRKKDNTALNLSTQANNAVLGRNAVGNGPNSVSGGHSFMTNFTQSAGAIDAAEVDPVAEAEVYMAYGRDAQAEEILKDALTKDPSRQEVRQKLLELYAARPDTANFEKLAREFHASTDGQGAAWNKVAAMGLGIDPANPLYQLAEGSVSADSKPSQDEGMIDLDQELFGELAAPAPAPVQPEVQGASAAASEDPLRAALFTEESAPPAVAEANMLDFDLDAELAASAATTSEPEVVVPPEPAAEPVADNNLLDFDFNLDGLAAAESAATADAHEAVGSLDMPPTTDGFESLYEDMVAATPATPATPPAPPAAAAPVAVEGMTLLDDPLSTKLDLAKVYLDMGDRDGAKEVLQDLLGEAQGSLQEEARALLTKISN